MKPPFWTQAIVILNKITLTFSSSLQPNENTDIQTLTWVPFSPTRPKIYGALGIKFGFQAFYKMLGAFNRPIYIGQNQNPKNLGFLLYRLHCQKNP